MTQRSVITLQPCSQRSARGLSLVELMISMVIGLFLVIGATTIYVNTRKTSDIDDNIARLQETARYAMSVIESDVRMANYWGLAKDATLFTNKLSPADQSAKSLVISTDADSCGVTYPIDVAAYLTGHQNGYRLSCAAFDGPPGSGQTGNALASADTLTVRRAAIAVTVANPLRLQVCATRSSATLQTGGACEGEFHDLLVNTYYVNTQSNQNTNIPSLRRLSLTNHASGPAIADTEIVSGVEDLQIQFGWNPTGASGVAASYLNPENVSLGSGQIVAVRVWLLVRADAPDGAYTDIRTYQYGDRLSTNGVQRTLNAPSAAGKAYRPNDHYRRLLISRTFFVRNAVGS